MWQLVGREREAAWEAARLDRGRVMCVGGEEPMHNPALVGGVAHRGAQRRGMRRLSLLAALALVLTLAAATPAMAENPEHTYGGTQVTVPAPFGVACQGFIVLFTAKSEYNIVNFYDDAGQLVKQIRQVSFTGTLYNSTDLSKSVPYEGDFTRTFDAVENTATYTGLHFRVHVPDEGVLALEVGRDIVDLLSGQQVFFDGNHNLADFDAEICGLLQ
jgi:hypothetical protein